MNREFRRDREIWNWNQIPGIGVWNRSKCELWGQVLLSYPLARGASAVLFRSCRAARIAENVAGIYELDPPESSTLDSLCVGGSETHFCWDPRGHGERAQAERSCDLKGGLMAKSRLRRNLYQFQMRPDAFRMRPDSGCVGTRRDFEFR